MLQIMLAMLLVAAPEDDGEFFRDSATSSIHVKYGTWEVTNVTWEEDSVLWKGKPTSAIFKRTEKMNFDRGTNERPRDFLVEVFIDFAKKPAFSFKAHGDTLSINYVYYATRTGLGLDHTTEVFDIETNKRFLVAGSEFFRVALELGREDAFVGYEKIDAKGVHGRLVLTTRKGIKSEVTFRQKEGGKVLHWEPKLVVEKTFVKLRFQSEADHVVEVPITNGKLNGKDQSVLDLP